MNMKTKKEQLEFYRDVLEFAKWIQIKQRREAAIKYLDEQTNERFDIYRDKSKRNKAKVKVLTLGSNHTL